MGTTPTPVPNPEPVPAPVAATEPVEDEPPTTPAPPPPPAATGPADSGGGPPPGETPRSPWKAIALIALVVVLGLGAVLLLKDDGDDKQVASSTTTTTAATASDDCPTPNDEYTAVTDGPAGFTLEYPASWQPIREASGEERLLLSAGGQCYFQVTVRRAASPESAQAEIDEALKDLEKIAEPQPVTLNGRPATLYLYYTPKTEDSPVEGVHVHYFLLNGDQVYSMVFQALPASELTDLVPAFDRVAKSFSLQPQTPTSGDTTTTTGG